jgi:hypothetical protein
MTPEPNKNPAASIRTRLLLLAQNKGEDYQRVLGRYAIERFLYRLGRSPYRTALRSKARRCLRCGQARRIGPPKTWTCSDGGLRPSVT